jgi:glucose/arabinose dehydrogenase
VRRFGWLAVALGVLVVLFVGAGTAAGLCKFALDCGLRASEPPPTGLEDFAEQATLDMQLPEGLGVATIASGLRYPTDFDVFPDGRIVVSEKDGLLRLVKDGAVLDEPFLDLRQRVNIWFFRGVTNVDVDPDFPERPYVYVSYAARGAGRESTTPTSVLLSRFEVRGDSAVASSERVIVGRAGAARPCSALPKGADCLPAVGDHIGADVLFADDGTMFVSTGDGAGESEAGSGQAEGVEETSLLAQDLDTLGGKILHVDRKGRGLPENPYWDGDPNSNRSRIWASGLRNPFRMSFVPGTETIVVGDVGWKSFEELTIVERGSNHGWPCREGPEQTPVYQDHPLCRAFYAGQAEPVEPWLTVAHPELLSITGGLVLESADGWPDDFAGRYVFADWLKSQIFTVPFDPAAPAGEYEQLARNAGGPVAFKLADNGTLYYLAVNIGELRAIGPR